MKNNDIKMFENGLIWILGYLVLTTGLIVTFLKIFKDKKR
jgi:hypothetical protein